MGLKWSDTIHQLHLLKHLTQRDSHGPCATDARIWEEFVHWQCTRERSSFVQTKVFTFPRTQVRLGQSGIVLKRISLISKTWGTSWSPLPLTAISMLPRQVASAGLSEGNWWRFREFCAMQRFKFWEFCVFVPKKFWGKKTNYYFCTENSKLWNQRDFSSVKFTTACSNGNRKVMETAPFS